MSADQQREAEDLFHEALDLSPDERAAFIDRSCGDDSALRTELESLLAADRRATDFLADPAWSLLSDSGSPEGIVVEPGLPAERLNEYRLVRRIGQGGMGIVYEAIQEPLGRRVALKVIRPERVSSPEIQARFWREVDVVAGLRHPGVVTVYGGGEDQGICYFAMELVDGRGLDELLAEAAGRGEPLETEQALRWILEVAQGLEHAHASGIIHRDVKPSNIRINSSDRAMLMDFGVARDEARSSLTITGEFRGTPHYASPEQIRGDRSRLDERTDVYSLGVTLYEAVTGRVPFEGETTHQVFQQILESDAVPPRQIRPSISRDLETVTLEAMERDRHHRYSSMESFADDLRRLLAGAPIEARPPGWTRRSAVWMRRHRKPVVAVASVLLLIAGIAVGLVVVSEVREANARAAEQMFVPLRETLVLTRGTTRRGATHWIQILDPEDPGGHLIQALNEVDEEDWRNAAEALTSCIARCEARDEAHLLREASYLLGLVLSARATSAADDQDRSRLEGQAITAFERSVRTEFAPLEALIARSAGGPANVVDFDPSSLRELRLNPNHHLSHLLLAMTIVESLHRGGEIEDFEEAITHYEEVLQARPDHRVALTYLGRTYYFLARHHGFIELTDRAEKYLLRALEVSGERVNHVIPNTLASVCLLRGELQTALEWNEMALERLQDQDPLHAQNIFTCMASVEADMGRLGEARNTCLKALELVTHDSSALLAMAEIRLRQGELDEAFRYAELATDAWHSPPFLGLAAADVIMACVHLRRRQDSMGVDLLIDTHSSTRFAAAERGRASLLLTTLTAEMRGEIEHRGQGLAYHIDRLSYIASNGGRFEGRLPAIGLSAVGAHHLAAGNPESAIDELQLALAARERWPSTARDYHWSEDARDHYLLAMAHHELAADDPQYAERSREYFELAESAFASGRIPVGDADVLTRVRVRARDVFGLGD